MVILQSKLYLYEMVQLKNFPTQAYAILDFYKNLRPAFDLPEGISVMNPFADDRSWQLTKKFYNKFYADADIRHFIFGINPGRFGGGITGIPFTDPLRLEEQCGIQNDFKKLPELSSLFIYEMIAAYGGVQSFYKDFFITALSPLGFVKDRKNLNYYDDKQLLRSCEAFIVACINQQLKTIASGSIAFCLGEGENFKYFHRLNEKYHFFEKIIPLPHPRWIMQYRRKRMHEYVELYVRELEKKF